MTRRNPWSVVAVALLPVLALALLLAALWNPQERLNTVRAAIVNLDEPVQVNGQTVPLGRQLAAGLVSGQAPSTTPTAKAVPASDQGYDWVITDASAAREGLDDGTYAAVVTIPKNFSAAATSISGDPADAEQATIDVATPPGGRVVDEALAGIVATTATGVMSDSITETYVDNVLVGFTTLHDQLGQASDGAHQLASGAGSAASGADQLADGAGQLADGASASADGAEQLADGAGQLADGADAAAAGAGQLADGASAAASGAAGLATGATGLADGAEQVAGGAGQVADGLERSKAAADQLAAGAGDLRAQLGAAAGGARTAADGVATAGTRLGTAVDTLEGANDVMSRYLVEYLAERGCEPIDPAAESCRPYLDLLTAMGTVPVVLEGDGTPANPGLRGAADSLKAAAGARADDPTRRQSLDALANGLSAAASEQGTGRLQSGAQQLGAGLGQLATAADQVAAGASGVADGADALAGGASQVSSGVGQLATGAAGLQSGVGQLASGATGLRGGASALSGGVGQLATGASGLQTGAADLSSGVGQLRGGADQLAGGLDQAVDQVPSYSDDERATLASVVADPVRAPAPTSLGSGSTGPLFAVVALWLGALALTLVFRPVPPGVLGSTRGSVGLALRSLAAPSAIGAGTGAVVGGILAGVQHLSPLGWLGAILVGALVSVCFVVVNQGLVGLLGDVGRAVSILVAVLAIATGVVATVPSVLVAITDVLPVGSAQDALTGLVIPGVGGTGAGIAALVGWLLLGVVLTVAATARRRRVHAAQLVAA